MLAWPSRSLTTFGCSLAASNWVAHLRALGHVPLIDAHTRRGQEKRAFAPHEAQRFKERSTSERVFARLKEEFGGRMIRVRGPAKVMTSLMFGIIALTADQLLRLVI